MARPAPSPQVSASGPPAADATRATRLRFWIVIVGTLALAALAGSSTFDVWRSYHQNISEIHRDLGNMAKALAEQAEVSVQLADLLLRETAAWYQNGHPAPGDAADARLAAKTAGLPPVREVRVIDEHGLPRFRSRRLPGDEAPLSDRPYFVAQRDHPRLGLVLSDPLLTQIEHRPAIVMSRRLEKPDGTFDGIVQAVVDLGEFQRIYEAIDLGPGSATTLLRADGTLIVRQPQNRELVGRKFPEMIATGADPSGLVLHTMDQRAHFVGIALVGEFPLVVAVSRERTVALEAWRDEAWHVAVRTLILLLLGAAAIVALVYQLRRVEAGERALRQSEERYALAMEGANEGHFDWNLEQVNASFVSPKAKQLSGRPADAPVTTREAWMASMDIHPDDAARVDAGFREHLDGRSDRYEVEFRIRYPDGQWHWVQVRGRCIRDGSGNVLRIVGSSIDISERKNAEAEKERLELQLRQSQKLEAMGTLAGGIAHDFNNILGAILGYGELAQKAAPEGAVRRYVDNVMQAGGRAKALVERILAFSRSGVGERGPVNVQAVIEETLELLAASLPAGVSLTRRLDGGNAAIIGDASQLHQVAMNLGANALQAMENGGVLEVVLDRADVAQSRRLSHGGLSPGKYVRLCVSDTGSGIPPDVLDRVFDPFFTTKSVGEGTGLGLSLVHGIVTDLGGAIDVRTAVGRGTTFTIWLPTAGEASAPSAEVAAELPHGRGQTVMIVDDEKALVALSEEMLAELGYEPVGFGSSVAALEAFRETPERFDIVLTDETMPELIGTALADKIHELRPDVPIVLMSGYAGAQILERAREAGISEILRKPLQSKDIAECLWRVLRSLDSRKRVQS